MGRFLHIDTCVGIGNALASSDIGTMTVDGQKISASYPTILIFILENLSNFEFIIDNFDGIDDLKNTFEAKKKPDTRRINLTRLIVLVSVNEFWIVGIQEKKKDKCSIKILHLSDRKDCIRSNQS
ncbi:MAG: hypothetical protein J7647_23365 [Cyanobacteria bacterium SBLK]|nr:hypothetical protein [Cyanobacteria bacterium SBLK]